MWWLCLLGHISQLDPPPEYLKTRIEIFDRLKAEHDAIIAGNIEFLVVVTLYQIHLAKEPTPITVTLPDGKEVKGQSWKTTPIEVIASSVRYTNMVVVILQ